MTSAYMNFDVAQTMPDKSIADNTLPNVAAVPQRKTPFGKKPVQFLAAAAFIIVGAAVLVSPTVVRADLDVRTDMEQWERPNATISDDHRDLQRGTWSLQADQIAEHSAQMRTPADVRTDGEIFRDQRYPSDGVE